MVDFARTVFGEDFDESCVVTESRLDLAEWVAGAADAVRRLPIPACGRVRGRRRARADVVGHRRLHPDHRRPRRCRGGGRGGWTGPGAGARGRGARRPVRRPDGDGCGPGRGRPAGAGDGAPAGAAAGRAHRGRDPRRRPRRGPVSPGGERRSPPGRGPPTVPVAPGRDAQPRPRGVRAGRRHGGPAPVGAGADPDRPGRLLHGDVPVERRRRRRRRSGAGLDERAGPAAVPRGVLPALRPVGVGGRSGPGRAGPGHRRRDDPPQPRRGGGPVPGVAVRAVGGGHGLLRPSGRRGAAVVLGAAAGDPARAATG